MRINFIDAVVEKGGPVVRYDFIQVADQLVKSVSDNERSGVATLAQKNPLEVIEGLLIVGHLADESIGIEPEEFAFIVVVLPTLPVGPRRIAIPENAGGNRSIFSGTPFTAGCVVETRGRPSQDVTVLQLRPESGARGEDVAEILRHAFVNPEQGALLRCGEIPLVQANRAAILAVP